MTKTISIPKKFISELGLSEGECAAATVEVRDGNALISVSSQADIESDETQRKRPDFAARIQSTFGDKTIESNPILKEREESKW